MLKIMTLVYIFQLSLSAVAADWIVTAMVGNESKVISLSKKETKLKIGQKLFAGENVITGANNKVKLISQETSLMIAENTNLILGELQNNERFLNLTKGKYRIQVDPEMAKQMKFKTPSSVTGVRGTEFFMSAASDKEIICVLEGIVETQDLATQKTVELKQNQGWFKEPGKDAKVQETQLEQRTKWLESTTL